MQISDLHLMETPEDYYRDIDVESSFLRITKHIQRDHQDADLLLLTGDCVHSGGAEVYQRIQNRLNQMNIPWRWIPGNHDDAELMAMLFGSMLDGMQLGRWQVTLLDSTSEGNGWGRGSLSEQELERLAVRLSLSGPHFIVLHHNPLSVNSRWQDEIALANRTRFLALLDQCSDSGVVIFGHVHQDWEFDYGRWKMFSCPSTGVQFKKCCDSFQIETRVPQALPGYRWFRLNDDGNFMTRVERCKG
ncbi:metallophosphoesterase [Motiliproteus sp. MSK22-1]|uniref:metallophosphoesterase n=1 Tax=Motiliproteus sp. MSK22-1 TaxID=1897630 RepID=UPI001E58DB57|nr:metallophosphoesterase [Motiliproteus sp. MSK22-1]